MARKSAIKTVQKPTNTIVHTCEECVYHEWFTGTPGNPWNCNIQTGEPITMHCVRDKNNIIKGIFKGTKACEKFSK